MYSVDPATFDAYKKNDKKNTEEKKNSKQVSTLHVVQSLAPAVAAPAVAAPSSHLSLGYLSVLLTHEFSVHLLNGEISVLSGECQA